MGILDLLPTGVLCELLNMFDKQGLQRMNMTRE
jgi:hypothetical protein